jgi:anti-anti-sigma factor
MNEQLLKVESERAGEVVVLTVSGELDQASAERLAGPLTAAIDDGAVAVLVDLSDCGFIDSTGLSVLVRAQRALAERTGDPRSFSICCPDPQVRRVLEITGLDQTMATFEGRDEALAAVGG